MTHLNAVTDQAKPTSDVALHVRLTAVLLVVTLFIVFCAAVNLVHAYLGGVPAWVWDNPLARYGLIGAWIVALAAIIVIGKDDA